LRVPRRIIGPNMEEETVVWINLHNEELHNFYFTPHITREIKSMKMRWAVDVACMGETR
jgi:hypothetical protein